MGCESGPPTSPCAGMTLPALVAALGLLGATHLPPDLHRPTSAVEVQPGAMQITPGAFSSQHGAYFKTPEELPLYMQQLFDHAPADLPPWTLPTTVRDA